MRGPPPLSSRTATSTADSPRGPLPPGDAADGYPRRWLTLGTVAVGIFMAVLDSSMVNIALPAITQGLGTDLSTVQWVVTAYLLTITSLLLSFGRLADIVGRKPVYVAGFTIFTIASGLCGLAQSIEQLILLRAVQGAGAAMTMAISPAITAAAFPPTERGKALGINATVVALGASLGPTLGGLLLNVMDWRVVFFARVPIGVAGVLLAALVLRERFHPGQRQRFDLAGAAVLSMALSALLLGMNRGQQEGWGSPLAIGLFLSFVVLMAAFVALEMRVRQPMLELTLFRSRVFAAANASAMFSFTASSGPIFLMPFFLTGVMGYDPARTGLLMTASPIAIALVGPASGWLSDRVGSRWLSSAGLAITCLGLLLLSGLGPGATDLEVMGRLAVMGMGGGMFQSPNNSAIMGSVSRARLGIASGMLATMRNLGMAMGVAVAGAVYATQYGHYLDAQTGNMDQVAASLAAFHDAYLAGAVFAFVGVFTSLVRGQDRPEDRPANRE